MNAAIYTKIAKSETYNNADYSIGFRRYVCLPNHVKVNLLVAAALKEKEGSTEYECVISFFQNMTEKEYRQYVITH